MDTAIAIVGILLGLVFCLCGYAAHRLWCACNGMLLGVSVGSLLGMQLQSPVFMVVCGALLGLGLAVVFFRFERIGSAVSLAVTGFACGLLILRSFDSTAWPWALLAAGVGAGVSWLRPRPAALTGLALSGSLLLVMSLFGVFTKRYWFVYDPATPLAAGETAVFLFFSVLLMAAAGLALQVGLLRRRDALSQGYVKIVCVTDGEVSERFKELVLKTSDSKEPRVRIPSSPPTCF